MEYIDQTAGLAGLAYGFDIARIWREKGFEIVSTLTDSDSEIREFYFDKFSTYLDKFSLQSGKVQKISLRELSGVGGPSEHLI